MNCLCCISFGTFLCRWTDTRTDSEAVEVITRLTMAFSFFVIKHVVHIDEKLTYVFCKCISNYPNPNTPRCNPNSEAFDLNSLMNVFRDDISKKDCVQSAWNEDIGGNSSLWRLNRDKIVTSDSK